MNLYLWTMNFQQYFSFFSPLRWTRWLVETGISLFPLDRLEGSCCIFPCSLSRFSSIQFSHSVVSDSLRPHESQHTRPPCPSPTPGVYSNPCHRVSDALQPSHPLSSPSPHAPNPSQHQGLLQ